MTVSTAVLVEDPIHESVAKIVEQEHPKAIIVFERAEKKRQQQFLRDEAAAADALQREAAQRQQTIEHPPLRSFPISANTSETSNFFRISTVFPLSAFVLKFDIALHFFLLQQQLSSPGGLFQFQLKLTNCNM